jgi:cyclophilin family peptidyl-prolyl cis-trans isomerase
MEMAPLDLMPHTVNLFLQQVHRQLWDGTYVTVNARHVIQIGPSYEDAIANVGSDEQRSYHHFHAEGLDKVSYQEYSPKYPHEQYTIGMAGRPSGPDFYINKMNNTVMHGPGGQMNDSDMHNEADPCFGRMVNGTGSFVEILAAIDQVPLKSDYPDAKVLIKTARILLLREGGGLVLLEPGKKWDQNDKIMPLPEIPHGV